MNNRLIKSNDAGGGGCTNTVDLYNPFPDGGGVALYQLNGDATDVSGNYNGTWTGTSSYSTGVFGQAATFNGSNQGIILPSVNLGSNFTISCWFKWDGVDNNQNSTIVGSSDENPSIIHNKFSTLNQIVYDTSGSSIEIFNNVVSGVWYNITVTQNGTEVKTYVNGSFSSSGTITALTATIEGIGYDPNQSRWLNGAVDQVRFFNRALRPYEVEALYTEEYCTPTIVPSEHFNTVTYTGNSGAQSITSVGFAPDLTWIKERTGTDHHRLQDTVRGAGYRLYSSTTSAEGYTNDSITSFDANGFSLGSSLGVNESGQNYVAWNFKAGGAAVTNTDGTITSQVSANTEAGFSIVSYTGNSTNGATVGHGLGVEPSMVIFKNRSITSNWAVYSKQVGVDYTLFLNSTDAKISVSNKFAGTNSSVIGLNSAGDVNSNSIIAYCFAEVEGFSNFGSYVGTGASGNTIVTGFEPAFVMLKRTDSTGNWFMLDNKRDNTNPNNLFLLANASDAEKDLQTTDSLDFVNFLENGFEILNGGSWCNANGGSYIYMAFAADPTAVEPTLEDSFNTVLYTGNGGTQSITGVGFQPDFTWLKGRDSTWFHLLYDSVRGATKKLNSNSTNAESIDVNILQSFDNNGFTLGSSGEANFSGQNYVAWNWKGAEIPAINSNGSIPSVVSANPAAGFSIVSYKGNSIIGSTVGHGLNVAPDVVIYKGRQEGLPQYFANWGVYHSSLGATQRLWMNNDGAAQTAGGGDWINNTEPTDSVFTVGEYYTNWTGRDFIAYCFAEVAGFSKFGSYTGNGLPLGPTITTGFEPAFVLIKRTNLSANWILYDNKRDTTNPNSSVLIPNLSAAEITNAADTIDFNSTSFQLKSGMPSTNGSGDTYIYMAFANQF